MHEIYIYPDQPALMRASAYLLITLANEAIEQNGRFSIALSGGSTPAALFDVLATQEFATQLDWSKVHVFWGDERSVPPHDSQSNYKLAHDRLLTKVPLVTTHIHRMHGEVDAQRAAAEYEGVLLDYFGRDSVPQFDLVLLGMGDDGHTASLFPYTSAIYEDERRVIGHFIEKLETWRITLTPVVLNNAANVIFLVCGESKANAAKQVLEGEHDPDRYPSQIVQPQDGRLIWMLDKSAARQLEHTHNSVG